MERAYRNLGYALLGLPAVMIAGFWVPYISRFPNFDPFITPAVHAHAAVLFTWVALVVAQPLLIRSRRFAGHKALGQFSYGLVPCIVLLSMAMMRKEYQEKIALGVTSTQAILDEFLSCAQIVLFAFTYFIAVLHARRRQIGAHLRYMVCIALILLPAGLARTLGYWFDVGQKIAQTVCLTLIVGGLVGLIAYDKRKNADFRPYVIVLASYLIIGTVWGLLGAPV